jgi:hypothetical protein
MTDQRLALSYRPQTSNFRDIRLGIRRRLNEEEITSCWVVGDGAEITVFEAKEGTAC